MKTVGGLILLVSIAMIVVVGTIAVDKMTSEAQASNDTDISQSATQSASITSPVILLIGFCVLLIGITIAINAYR